MTDATQIVDQYIAAWNETDPAQRRALIEQAFTEDVAYLDPIMRGEGQDGIAALIEGTQQQFLGFRFRLAGPADRHNDCIRFTWELVARDDESGEPLVVGTDFGTLAPDGRLHTVTGFLDKVPATALG
jgi:limonene-1,2-epoxide hydrolase